MYLPIHKQIVWYAGRMCYIALGGLCLIAVLTVMSGCGFNFGGGGKTPTRSSVRYNHAPDDGGGLDALGSAFQAEAQVPYDLCIEKSEFELLGERPPHYVILRFNFKRGEAHAVYAHPDVARADEPFEINPKAPAKCAPMGKVATEGMPHKTYPFFYQPKDGEVTRTDYKLVPLHVFEKKHPG
jgi:hypothetical protein